jgi:rubredoxin
MNFSSTVISAPSGVDFVSTAESAGSAPFPIPISTLISRWLIKHALQSTNRFRLQQPESDMGTSLVLEILFESSRILLLSDRKDKLMPEAENYSHLARRPTVAKLRALIWNEEARFQGWRCSECAWVFNPSGPPEGNSLVAMMEHYERLRDKEFATHVCAEHPRTTKTQPKSSLR